MYTYKNKNTHAVQVFPERNGRLEFLNEWEPVDSVEVSPLVAQAADRAAAERAAIQGAAAIRLDSAAGAAIAQVAGSQAQNTGAVNPAQPLPTLSVIEAPSTQASSLVAALDKQHPSKALPTTSFDANKLAAEQEIRNPPTSGVLARAKADQHAGRTQVGEHPERHETVQAAQRGATDPVKPGPDADKPAWVAWAVSQGASEQAANGMTVQQLIDQYGK